MSQTERVYMMLERAGEHGVSTSEFLREYLYEFRSRISEMRSKGKNIACERIGKGNFKYRIVAKEQVQA